jgi:hypothetical protein
VKRERDAYDSAPARTRSAPGLRCVSTTTRPRLSGHEPYAVQHQLLHALETGITVHISASPALGRPLERTQRGRGQRRSAPRTRLQTAASGRWQIGPRAQHRHRPRALLLGSQQQLLSPEQVARGGTLRLLVEAEGRAANAKTRDAKRQPHHLAGAAPPCSPARARCAAGGAWSWRYGRAPHTSVRQPQRLALPLAAPAFRMPTLVRRCNVGAGGRSGSRRARARRSRGPSRGRRVTKPWILHSGHRVPRI